MFLEVMWRYLEQKSFHLTKEEYDDQLEAIASLLSDWQVVDQATQGLAESSDRGPGITGGRAAKSIMVRLDVSEEVLESW
jgi:hypothetical protein